MFLFYTVYIMMCVLGIERKYHHKDLFIYYVWNLFNKDCLKIKIKLVLNILI